MLSLFSIIYMHMGLRKWYLNMRSPRKIQVNVLTWMEEIS